MLVYKNGSKTEAIHFPRPGQESLMVRKRRPFTFQGLDRNESLAADTEDIDIDEDRFMPFCIIALCPSASSSSESCWALKEENRKKLEAFHHSCIQYVLIIPNTDAGIQKWFENGGHSLSKAWTGIIGC
jgi:hypothetical protein